MRWGLAIYFCFSGGFGARKTGGARDAITCSDGFRSQRLCEARRPLWPSSKPLASAILTAWETLGCMRRTRCMPPGGACKALQGFVPGQPSGASRGPTQNLCSPNPGLRAAFGGSPNRHSIQGFHPSGIGSTGLRRGLRGFSPGALARSSSSMQRAAPTSLAGPWR